MYTLIITGFEAALSGRYEAVVTAGGINRSDIVQLTLLSECCSGSQEGWMTRELGGLYQSPLVLFFLFQNTMDYSAATFSSYLASQL
jgi:uncharacterized protein (DUF1919 family)